MLCEVSHKTFGDFIDTYPNELFIKNKIDYPKGRMLSFLDYSQDEENIVVAEEFIDFATNKPILFKIKQIGN